jgi:hypothetical protein
MVLSLIGTHASESCSFIQQSVYVRVVALIYKLVATHLNRTAYRREKQASICINTHVASIYRQRMFLGQTMSTPCPLCLYIGLLRGICLLASSSSGLVWLGCKAELADLHNVMRRLASLAQPIQRSTSRALNSHQTREHESSTDCLTKWWHLGSNPSRSEGIMSTKAVAKCGV